MNATTFAISTIAAFALGLTIAATIILVGHDSEDTDHARRRRALGRAAAGRARAQTPPESLLYRLLKLSPWRYHMDRERWERRTYPCSRWWCFRRSPAYRSFERGGRSYCDQHVPNEEPMTFPPASAELRRGGGVCGATSDDLVCTLPAGHSFVHQCGSTYWSTGFDSSRLRGDAA